MIVKKSDYGHRNGVCRGHHCKLQVPSGRNEQEQEDGKLHPISYASRTLSKHESRYGITDLEALGVVWACKHYRAYLLGHHCVVYTDHAPLKAMLKAKHPSGRLARWAGIISELDLDIQYRPGRKNSNADALSWSLVEHDTAEELVEAEGVVVQVESVAAGGRGVGQVADGR